MVYTQPSCCKAYYDLDNVAPPPSHHTAPTFLKTHSHLHIPHSYQYSLPCTFLTHNIPTLSTFESVYATWRWVLFESLTYLSGDGMVPLEDICVDLVLEYWLRSRDCIWPHDLLTCSIWVRWLTKCWMSSLIVCLPWAFWQYCEICIEKLVMLYRHTVFVLHSDLPNWFLKGQALRCVCWVRVCVGDTNVLVPPSWFLVSSYSQQMKCKLREQLELAYWEWIWTSVLHNIHAALKCV